MFLKELCTFLTYISPYPTFVTHQRNFKKDLSSPDNINKLCSVHISLFLWWAKDNFRVGLFSGYEAFFHRFRIIILCTPGHWTLVSNRMIWLTTFCFFLCPSFVIDTFHIALQSTREITAAEMVHNSPWQGKKEDHPGDCSDCALSWSEDEQFYWLEGAKTCL